MRRVDGLTSQLISILQSFAAAGGAITQLVNKSAAADLRAIKQLTDIVQGVERRSEVSPAPQPRPAFTAADEEVIAELRKRIERDIRAKIAAENTPTAP